MVMLTPLHARNMFNDLHSRCLTPTQAWNKSIVQNSLLKSEKWLFLHPFMLKTVLPFRQNRLRVSPWPIYPKWTSWGVKCPFYFFQHLVENYHVSICFPALWETKNAVCFSFVRNGQNPTHVDFLYPKLKLGPIGTTFVFGSTRENQYWRKYVLVNFGLLRPPYYNYTVDIVI